MSNFAYDSVSYKVRKIRPLKEGSKFFKFTVGLLRLVIRFKVARVSLGEEKIPEKGAAIVIAPHLNELDAMIAPEFVTRAGRMPRIFAKASLWKILPVKWAFDSGRLIPVQRGSKDAAKSLEIAKEGLASGDVVFIFPEGTCSKDPDSWPMTCKTGAARLALISGAPVIPVLQDGAQFLYKKQNARKDLPWYNKYHKKRFWGRDKVLVQVQGFDPIDFSVHFPSIESNDNGIVRSNGNNLAVIESPTEAQIVAVNKVIEDTLTQIIEGSRGVKAPKRWDLKLNGRVQ